jgi:hypothetical protein
MGRVKRTPASLGTRSLALGALIGALGAQLDGRHATSEDAGTLAADRAGRAGDTLMLGAT